MTNLHANKVFCVTFQFLHKQIPRDAVFYRSSVVCLNQRLGIPHLMQQSRKMKAGGADPVARGVLKSGVLAPVRISVLIDDYLLRKISWGGSHSQFSLHQ